MRDAAEILSKPWPQSQGVIRVDQMPDLPPEEKERLGDENKFIRESNANERRLALQEKLAVVPVFTVTLSSEDDQLYVKDGNLDVNVEVAFAHMPDGSNQSIVLTGLESLLGDEAVNWGLFQIYSDSHCSENCRAAFTEPNVSLRPARDGNGRFIAPAEVRVNSQWLAMQPGQRIERRVTLNLRSNQGWRDSLGVGKDYWLQYAPQGLNSAFRAEIASWRFGTLEVSRACSDGLVTCSQITGRFLADN